MGGRQDADRRRRLGGLSSREGAAWGGLLRTHARVIRKMSAELETGHGLSLRSYDVLRQVALHDDARLRMAELAERVMLTRPGLSGVVARLEDRGLLRREPDPHDGRGAFACLTPEGERKLMEAQATHLASIREHFVSLLGEDELEALADIWAKLERG